MNFKLFIEFTCTHFHAFVLWRLVVLKCLFERKCDTFKNNSPRVGVKAIGILGLCERYMVCKSPGILLVLSGHLSEVYTTGCATVLIPPALFMHCIVYIIPTILLHIALFVILETMSSLSSMSFYINWQYRCRIGFSSMPAEALVVYYIVYLILNTQSIKPVGYILVVLALLFSSLDSSQGFPRGS